MEDRCYENKLYDVSCYEFPYMIYNQQIGMWLSMLEPTMAVYTKNIDYSLRFSSPTLADQLCVQMEDATHQSHIVFME